jgi:hypothetical protein
MHALTIVLLLLLNVLSGSPSPAPQSAGPPVVQEEDVTDLRALLVFVRFRDDAFDHEGLDARGWPAYSDLRRLPTFAGDLLAEDAGSITESDITLSRYFYEQSRLSQDSAGRFRLFGEIHPRSSSGQPLTYVTRYPNAHYHRSSGRGYGYLVQEILDHVFIEQGLDPARFDLSGDGSLDHVFIIIRSEEAQTARGGNVSYSGSSFLGGYGAIGGTPSEAPRYFSQSRGEEVGLDWQMSGSFLFTNTAGNMHTHKYHVNLMAHELGHELFRDLIRSTHLMPVTRNRVPANEPEPTRPRDYRYGFALMPGSPYTNGGGALTMSAHERALMGWIALDTLRSDRSTETIGDLYTTSDAYMIPLPVGGHRVYLTNHQRISYFDQVHRSSGFAFNPPFDQVATGLLTTGLLVTFSTAPNNLDVLPANNRMNLAVWFMTEPSPYDGIMYGPETGRQITPWTRPNINGCNGYSGDPLCASADFEIGWMAVDDIRNAGSGSQRMAFEFIPDFRQQPIIRSDSWIEQGADGTIPGDVIVERGATLHIVAGSRVSFEGRLTIEAGAEVVVEQGASVTFGPVDVRTGGRLTRL